MGADLQLEGDEGGDPKRQRTDDSNSEESVVSDSSDENRFGVRYKGHSTNNVGATQESCKRWTINRRCKVWKPHRNRTNDCPSNAVANAKGSLVAKLVKPMRMIGGLEAENADLHMQLKAAAKKIEELEAAAAASKKIEELKAAAKKIEELSVVMQVLLDPL